ncbi:MAG: DoxX family protein [Methylococcales bacterium]
MFTYLKRAHTLLNSSRRLYFITPLLLRLYLVPIFWMAGSKKYHSFENTVTWFGNAEWGLGLPFPWLLALLVTGVELVGAISLLLGLAVRWMCFPLLMTMLVAAITVHWQNGWLAIAEGSGFFANERTMGAIQRLDRAKDILQEHGNYSWLTENGSIVVLNNGIEFAATYIIMLLVLFFSGAGRYVSLDYWFLRYLQENEYD